MTTESSMNTEVNVAGPSLLSIPAPKPGLDVYQHVSMMMKVSYVTQIWCKLTDLISFWW